jgi:hypothetical protein
VLPVLPVLPVGPGGPAGPGEQAAKASIIREATINLEYFTVVPHYLNRVNCSIGPRAILKFLIGFADNETTFTSPPRLYADAHNEPGHRSIDPPH